MLSLLVGITACGEDFSFPAGVGKAIRKNWSVPVDGALQPKNIGDIIVGIGSSTGATAPLAVFDAKARKLLWKSRSFIGDTNSFAVSRTSVFKAATGGDLYAFDLNTGTLQGQVAFPENYKFEDSGFNSPQLVDNILALSSGDSVYTFDVSNPAAIKFLWKRTFIPGRRVSGFNAENNIVLAAIAAKSGNTTFALDLQDGHEIWASRPDIAGNDPNESRFIAGFVFAKDKLIAFDANQNLYALNPSNGERLWVGRYRDPKCESSLVVADGLVNADTLFMNADGGACMYAISLNTGQIKWFVDSRKYSGATGTFGGTPLYHNGVVYSGNGNLFAMDAETGQVLGISADVDAGRQFTQPFLINGEIVTWGRSVAGFSPVR